MTARFVIFSVILGGIAFWTGLSVESDFHQVGPVAQALFLLLSLVESLLLGAGISFLIVAYRRLLLVPKEHKRIVTTNYLCIGWVLISWWPHDVAHRLIGNDLVKLLFVEYGFHLTVIIATVILGYTFFKLLNMQKL